MSHYYTLDCQGVKVTITAGDLQLFRTLTDVAEDTNADEFTPIPVPPPISNEVFEQVLVMVKDLPVTVEIPKGDWGAVMKYARAYDFLNGKNPKAL
jgi:hypothetical protein